MVISFRSVALCLQHSCLFMHTTGSQRGGGPALRHRLAQLHGLGLPEPPMERQGPPGLVESSRIRGGHGRSTAAWVGLGPKGGQSHGLGKLGGYQGQGGVGEKDGDGRRWFLMGMSARSASPVAST